MFRFVFFCMILVALAILSLSAQFMVDDISQERDALLARNQQQPAQTTQQASQDSPSFDEIYAGADALETQTQNTAQGLNQIDPAAGAVDQIPPQPSVTGFGPAFTGKAPSALTDTQPIDPAN